MSLHRQRGQGSVEFVVVILLFLSLIGGLFEMTRIFRAKNTLNEATFMAAREGALNYAKLDPMVAQLGESMSDLFMTNSSPASLVQAKAKSTLLAEASQMAGAGIHIVSPTKDIFDQLSVDQFISIDDAEPARVRAIPNDNLKWRPNTLASLGDGRDISIKDANLLKIDAIWCQRLVVPGLDILIYQILHKFNNSPQQQACRAVSTAAGGSGIASGRYIAISADATIRMQTPVLLDQGFTGSGTGTSPEASGVGSGTGGPFGGGPYGGSGTGSDESDNPLFGLGGVTDPMEATQRLAI